MGVILGMGDAAQAGPYFFDWPQQVRHAVFPQAVAQERLQLDPLREGPLGLQDSGQLQLPQDPAGWYGGYCG